MQDFSDLHLRRRLSAQRDTALLILQLRELRAAVRTERWCLALLVICTINLIVTILGWP